MIGSEFSHETLDVYRVALKFLELASELAQGLPKAKGQLGDQLQRAAESIPLRIAEAVGGEAGSALQRKHYRDARGSAAECAAILDVCRARRAVSSERRQAGRVLLLRLVKMLSRLARRR